MILAEAFLSGAVSLGYLVAAMFFARFWVRTRDRLFAAFAAAFAILSLCEIPIGLTEPDPNPAHWYLTLRFLAFAIIIVAVIDKNIGGAK